MLIIARREGQKIVIGDSIVVEVLEIAGNSVRLGIEAPRSIPAYREEVWQAIAEENRAAASALPEQVDSVSDAAEPNKAV